tara:strand:- start:1173 stop:1346 length:174 start_codon:yes stop_codon:yes gene_type:complete
MANKVEKDGFTIKGQGKVSYGKTKIEKTDASSKPGMGKGKSRGGGAALRGTKFEGIY